MRLTSILGSSTLRTAVCTGMLGALPLMMGSEGGCTLLQDTLRSPVQAVTVLKELDDGTVVADLVIISTRNDDHYVTTAKNAELRTPDGDLIPLTQSSDGHYTATSDEFPELVYDPSGTNYRVTFELDDDKDAGSAAGDDFIAVLALPDDDVTFEMTKAPDFAGDTAVVEWTPGTREGLMEIRNEQGELVYSTFNWEHPAFDGSKWGSLIRGGREELRVDVFADPGRYTISFCAVASQEGFDEEVSGGLGILSGFLAGRCVEDLVIDVPE